MYTFNRCSFKPSIFKKNLHFPLIHLRARGWPENYNAEVQIPREFKYIMCSSLFGFLISTRAWWWTIVVKNKKKEKHNPYSPYLTTLQVFLFKMLYVYNVHISIYTITSQFTAIQHYCLHWGLEQFSAKVCWQVKFLGLPSQTLLTRIHSSRFFLNIDNQL